MSEKDLWINNSTAQTYITFRPNEQWRVTLMCLVELKRMFAPDLLKFLDLGPDTSHSQVLNEHEVTVNLNFDIWPPQSKEFVTESEWTVVLNLKEYFQSLSKILCFISWGIKTDCPWISVQLLNETSHLYMPTWVLGNWIYFLIFGCLIWREKSTIQII